MRWTSFNPLTDLALKNEWDAVLKKSLLQREIQTTLEIEIHFPRQLLKLAARKVIIYNNIYNNIEIYNNMLR